MPSILDTGDIKTYEPALNMLIYTIALMSSETLGAPPAYLHSTINMDVVGEPEIQKLEKSGRKVAEF